jgi:hypothetical protein
MKWYLIYLVIYVIGVAAIVYDVEGAALAQSLPVPSMWILSMCLGYLGLVWGAYELHKKMTQK